MFLFWGAGYDSQNFFPRFKYQFWVFRLKYWRLNVIIQIPFLGEVYSISVKYLPLQYSTCPSLFLSILGYQVRNVDPVHTFEGVFEGFKAKRTHKMAGERYWKGIQYDLLTVTNKMNKDVVFQRDDLYKFQILQFFNLSPILAFCNHEWSFQFDYA